MQSLRRATVDKRTVVGLAASVLAALGCSVCIERDDPPPLGQAAQLLFWSSPASTSNLAVVELQRSSAPSWGRGAP